VFTPKRLINQPSRRVREDGLKVGSGASISLSLSAHMFA
jgi:hypothetical protein